MPENGMSDPLKKPISNPLRVAITAKGISASALARAAGIDPGIVKRYLSGRRGLTLATADKLASILNLRLVDAEGAEGINPDVVTPPVRLAGGGDDGATSD